MISNKVITILENQAGYYADKGYRVVFNHDNATNNYELKLSLAEDIAATIRDGYMNGQSTNSPTNDTSFDIIFKVGDTLFAKYFSDYPLSEYEECLGDAFQLLDAFFSKDYDITLENKLFFRKKKYLNIPLSGATEHLLGKDLSR